MILPDAAFHLFTELLIANHYYATLQLEKCQDSTDYQTCIGKVHLLYNKYSTLHVHCLKTPSQFVVNSPIGYCCRYQYKLMQLVFALRVLRHCASSGDLGKYSRWIRIYSKYSQYMVMVYIQQYKQRSWSSSPQLVKEPKAIRKGGHIRDMGTHTVTAIQQGVTTHAKKERNQINHKHVVRGRWLTLCNVWQQ